MLTPHRFVGCIRPVLCCIIFLDTDVCLAHYVCSCPTQDIPAFCIATGASHFVLVQWQCVRNWVRPVSVRALQMSGGCATGATLCQLPILLSFTHIGSSRQPLSCLMVLHRGLLCSVSTPHAHFRRVYLPINDWVVIMDLTSAHFTYIPNHVRHRSFCVCILGVLVRLWSGARRARSLSLSCVFTCLVLPVIAVLQPRPSTSLYAIIDPLGEVGIYYYY